MTKKNQDATFEPKSNSESNTNNSSQTVQISPELLQQLAFSQQAQQQEDEIDLAELFKTIWAGKFKIIAITAVFAIASVFYALSLPNIYKAEALLAPATTESGGMGGLAAKFGGLASLAGVNLGGGSVDKTGLAIEIMKSRQFISKFINDNNLLVPLMAAEGWNQATNELIINTEVFNTKSNKWLRDVKPPFTAEPSNQEAFKEFNKIVSIAQDKDSLMVTISIEHYSPEIAQQWVDKLVIAINNEMKKRDLTEAQESINYLESQLQETNLAELQNVLYQIMEEQTKTIMFANVRDEYVFKTIDPALISEVKEKPKRALIVVLVTLLGGMISVAYILIRKAIK